MEGQEGRDIVTDIAPDDRDELYGDDGRDFLNGDDGDGRDRLDCGPGVDNFIADGGDRVLANCERNGI